MDNDNPINQDIDYSRYGPWDIRLKEFVKEQPVVMLVHNIDRETIEHEFKIDLGNPEDKKFLGRVSFWCVKNGRSVETMSIEDWDKVKE
jgi:hypothetical protein